MSKFAKFYGQLNMRSLRSWMFAAVLTDCVGCCPFSCQSSHLVDAVNN